MQYWIGGEGPRTAKLAIVAEKPGRSELEYLQQTGKGRPLIGVTGRAVDRHLIRIGTSRSEVYLTNAVKRFDTLGNPTNEDIKREQFDLYRELSELPNLNCVVAMGAAALSSLSNFHLADITRRRGSIFQSFIRIKCVPTFHPSFYMRGQWELRPVVEFDLHRSLEQSQFPELRLPQRSYSIEPTYSEAQEWLTDLISRKPKQISFDIETLRCGPSSKWYISCIAFSDDPSRAFSIPICKGDRSSYWSVDEEMRIWQRLQSVLLLPEVEFVTQNGLFDCWHLWRHGLETPHMAHGFDTMYAHRLIAPDLRHGLDFLASIYTEEPYYKDESGRSSKVTVPDRQYWTYNAKDAAVTLEVARAEQEDMAELHLLDYYRARMQPQWDALMAMRKGGLRIDTSKLESVRSRIRAEREAAEASLKTELGWLPNVKSYIDMGSLFRELGVSYSETPTGRPKSNEERMLDYARQAKTERARKVLVSCLEVTHRRTIESGFLGMVLDPRGYYHPSLDLSHAVSGRCSSEGADEGGPQIQNWPKSIRTLVVPDDNDSEITQADLKQAEAMFVAWDACDLLYIQAFEEGKDVHRIAASIIDRGWDSVTELPPQEMLDSITVVCAKCAAPPLNASECNHSERFRGKTSRHAFAYLQGVKRFCTEQARKGLYYSEAEGRRIRERAVTQAVTNWQDRTMRDLGVSPWLEGFEIQGLKRRREFYGLLDQETLRAALSWKAQAHVSDVLNVAIIHLHATLPRGARLLTQTHDSVTISNRRSQRETVRSLVETAFDTVVEIHGRPLRIPVEITHGPDWGTQEKTK